MRKIYRKKRKSEIMLCKKSPEKPKMGKMRKMRKITGCENTGYKVINIIAISAQTLD